MSRKMKAKKHEVVMLKIEELKSNPLNPRLYIRDKTVESFKGRLETMKIFPIMKALIVRKVDDGYVIVDGHHRFLAAQQAGIKEIPCWISEAETDEETLIEMSDANQQSAFSDVEMALLVHRYLEENTSNGATKELVDILKLDDKKITRLQKAGEVLDVIEKELIESEKRVLTDSIRFYIELGKADSQLWIPLTRRILKHSLKLNDLKRIVKDIGDLKNESVSWMDTNHEDLLDVAVKGISSVTERSSLYKVIKEIEGKLNDLESQQDQPVNWVWSFRNEVKQHQKDLTVSKVKSICEEILQPNGHSIDDILSNVSEQAITFEDILKDLKKIIKGSRNTCSKDMEKLHALAAKDMDDDQKAMITNVIAKFSTYLELLDEQLRGSNLNEAS